VSVGNRSRLFMSKISFRRDFFGALSEKSERSPGIP
jgi:hypothetical protein